MRNLMILFLFNFSSPVFSKGTVAPTPSQCRLAQDVSRQFSLAIANGKNSEAFKLWNGENYKTELEFENLIKRQLRDHYGKNTPFSFSTSDGTKVYCIQGGKSGKRFVDNRVLLYFDQKLENGLAKVLPVSIQLEWDGKKWLVSVFNSTAM